MTKTTKIMGTILLISAFIIGSYFCVIWLNYLTTNSCIMDYPREIIGGKIVHSINFTEDFTFPNYALQFRGYKKYSNTECYDFMSVTKVEYKRWLSQKGSD